MAHMHADVTENTYNTNPERRKCFTGERMLEDAQAWLASEIDADASRYPTPKEGDWHTTAVECRRWMGTGDSWHGEVTVPQAARPGYGVIMGYTLAWIDEDCKS